MKTEDHIGLYVHIPFCVRKCAYCDFLSFSAEKETQENYVNALCKQIDATSSQKPVASVYFGGGTPSILSPEWTRRILCKLEKFRIISDAEITLEVNPGTVGPGDLAAFKEMGFNRLSIGLQSANDPELKALGRIHSFADFQRTYEEARRAGFANINVDLMTAIPGQTSDSLDRTLRTITSLAPEHISAYSLILEEGTPLYGEYGGDKDRICSEDKERALYAQTVSHLKACGYVHYEISNFAREGFASRHNTDCWKRCGYLGFGLGASSFLHGVRSRNTTDLARYLSDPSELEESQVLSEQDAMEEFMFLGLRLLEGVSEDAFLNIFHAGIDSIYKKTLDRLVSEGLLIRSGGRIALTEKGIDYGNYVFSSFLL